MHYGFIKDYEPEISGSFQHTAFLEVHNIIWHFSLSNFNVNENRTETHSSIRELPRHASSTKLKTKAPAVGNPYQERMLNSEPISLFYFLFKRNEV